MSEQRKYRPSNGTEAMGFIDCYCSNCIHEHPENGGCDILSRTMGYDLNDPGYPSEWTYEEKGKPCCTAFSKWDWGNDDDRGFNEPPPPEPYNPRQMVMPFIIEETLKQQKELA